MKEKEKMSAFRYTNLCAILTRTDHLAYNSPNYKRRDAPTPHTFESTNPKTSSRSLNPSSSFPRTNLPTTSSRPYTLPSLLRYIPRSSPTQHRPRGPSRPPWNPPSFHNAGFLHMCFGLDGCRERQRSLWGSGRVRRALRVSCRVWMRSNKVGIGSITGMDGGDMAEHRESLRSRWKEVGQWTHSASSISSNVLSACAKYASTIPLENSRSSSSSSNSSICSKISILMGWYSSLSAGAASSEPSTASPFSTGFFSSASSPGCWRCRVAGSEKEMVARDTAPVGDFKSDRTDKRSSGLARNA